MTLKDILNNLSNLEKTSFGIYFNNVTEVNMFECELEKLRIKKDVSIGQKRIYQNAWRRMLSYCRKNGSGWFFYKYSYQDNCAWSDKNWEHYSTKNNARVIKFTHLLRKEKLKDL